MRIGAMDLGAMRLGGTRIAGVRVGGEPIAPWAGVLCAFTAGALLAWCAAAMLETRVRNREMPDDDALHDRVRMRVGQLVKRPEAVEISVEQGVVRLSGDVPPDERDTLLAQLVAIPGVLRVRNALAGSRSGA